MTEAPSTADERFERSLAAWGGGARIGERLGGGYRNHVREVRLDGRRFAGRLSLRPAPAIAWELDLLDHLRRVGLRVPLPLPAADGRRLVDGLVLFQWLDGDPPGKDADWRAVAVALRRLHRLTRRWPQRPAFRSTQALLVENRGGDVRLDLMPAEAVTSCRAAWQSLVGEPTAVVHGDPGAGNIRISGDGDGLLDCDEARVDASILDLASLPLRHLCRVPPDRLAKARRALDAWEAANGWVPEPQYARRRLAQLRAWPAPV